MVLGILLFYCSLLYLCADFPFLTVISEFNRFSKVHPFSQSTYLRSDILDTGFISEPNSLSSIAFKRKENYLRLNIRY